MHRQCVRVHRAVTGGSPPWLLPCSLPNNFVLELRYVVSSSIIHVKVSDVGGGCLVFGSLNVDWVELSLWQLMSVGVAGDGRLDRLARVGTSNGTN